MADDRELEALLNDALATYAAEEPDAGLNARALARLPESTPKPWRWWVLGPTGTCAAAFLIVLATHPFLRSPLPQSAPVPAIANSTRPIETPMPNLPAFRQAQHRGHRPHALEHLTVQQPAMLSRPRAATPEEKLLFSLISQHPREARAVLTSMDDDKKPIHIEPITIKPIHIAALDEPEPISARESLHRHPSSLSPLKEPEP